MEKNWVKLFLLFGWLYLFSSLPPPVSYKDRNSGLTYVTVNQKSAALTVMHKYNRFYSASNNCTCSSIKSCYSAWTIPERLQHWWSGRCRKNPCVPFAAPGFRGGGGEKAEWEQLINCGINRNTFSESWKIFASKILFDHCWLYIVRHLST